MDIIKPQQPSADDLQKVMDDLANDGVSQQVEVDTEGIPENITPPPPPPSMGGMPAPAQDDTQNSGSNAVTADQPAEEPMQQAPPSSLNGLNAIKLDAVEMLKPLIGSLDISPVEKFEAMIEIIRASDDQEMIGQAFETAKAIPNNDKRAQALIDIINEINYINKIKSN